MSAPSAPMDEFDTQEYEFDEAAAAAALALAREAPSPPDPSSPPKWRNMRAGSTTIDLGLPQWHLMDTPPRSTAIDLGSPQWHLMDTPPRPPASAPPPSRSHLRSSLAFGDCLSTTSEAAAATPGHTYATGTTAITRDSGPEPNSVTSDLDMSSSASESSNHDVDDLMTDARGAGDPNLSARDHATYPMLRVKACLQFDVAVDMSSMSASVVRSRCVSEASFL